MATLLICIRHYLSHNKKYRAHRSTKRGSSSFNLVPLLLLWIAHPNIVHGSSSCDLRPEYGNLFQDALDDLDQRMDALVSDLDDIGLPPLTDTLPITDILDLKSQVFDTLFGTADVREEWINGTTSEVLDIKDKLEKNVEKSGGEVIIACDFDEAAKRFKMDLTVKGSVPNLNIASSLLVPKVTFLPASLPSLDMTVPTIDASYELSLPLTVDLKNKKFSLGETKAEFGVKFSANVQKGLPLLADQAIDFDGMFDVEADFAYSSKTKSWLSRGHFDASLEATVADRTGLFDSSASLGILAADDNMFDDNPREYIV